MTKSEAVLAARRRVAEGFFDRQETAREPEELHFNRVTLECGHSILETEALRTTRERLGKKISCSQCAEAWIEQSAAGGPK